MGWLTPSAFATAACEPSSLYSPINTSRMSTPRSCSTSNIWLVFYTCAFSPAAVAKSLGVSQPTIDAWFEMLGIEIMTTTEAVLVKRK